jgi:inorganic triphosphatase YgiF
VRLESSGRSTKYQWACPRGGVHGVQALDITTFERGFQLGKTRSGEADCKTTVFAAFRREELETCLCAATVALSYSHESHVTEAFMPSSSPIQWNYREHLQALLQHANFKQA